MLEQRPVLATPPATSRAAASEVAGVGKRWPGRRSLFGRAAPAVDVLVNVTFAVRPGEIVVVLGENGAGKTTLLKIVGGLARPETGDVRVLGYDAGKPSTALYERVAYAGGERGFYFRLTVRENLAFFSALGGLRARARGERCWKLLRFPGRSPCIAPYDFADRTP